MRQQLTHKDRLQVILISLTLSFTFSFAFFLGLDLVVPPAAAERHDLGADDTPWEISADRIEFNQKTDEYLAEGNVTIAREASTLTADRVRLDQRNRLAWAEGRVRLLSGQDVLSGSRLQLHLDDETGVLSDGSLFFAESHFYLTGREIHKTGPETYHVKDATATTCDGPDPDWRITSSDIKVRLEGYGTARHAALWARQVPLIYTPYIVFPVKLRRQSGLLTPEFGYSERKGARYLQPLFWAIGESTDATFFADYMSERGTRLGAEFRYVASDTAKGTFMIDGFHDRRVDDGQPENESWGYGDDQRLRPNNDRYWFRAKIDQDLPLDLTAKLDLDVVSDQDYLKEFETGSGGLQRTRDYYRGTFGRDIDDFNEPIRLNQLNINRLWTGYTFNTDIRWYDDVVKRRQMDTNDTLQQLPQVTLDGTKKKIAESPFYFDVLSSYTHFYREDGTRGHRADLYPRTYYPVRFLDAFFFEPSAGIRQTAWQIDRYAENAQQDRNDHYRAIYDLRLDTSTDFFNIFEIDRAGHDRIKHNIRPQIVYEYIPDQDQQDLPLFDDWDRIAPRNRITYSLTNTLIARAPRLVGDQRSGPGHIYLPFLRFRLEQSFDINRYNQDNPQPFSNILAELHIRPGRYGLIQADALWSPYDSQFYAYNTGLWLINQRGDQLRTDYRFTRETETVRGVHALDITAAWQATRQWLIRGKYERNIEIGQRIETGMGISYLSQCWRIDLDFREEPGDQSIVVMVHLVGLGAFGQ